MNCNAMWEIFTYEHYSIEQRRKSEQLYTVIWTISLVEQFYTCIVKNHLFIQLL